VPLESSGRGSRYRYGHLDKEEIFARPYLFALTFKLTCSGVRSCECVNADIKSIAPSDIWNNIDLMHSCVSMRHKSDSVEIAVKYAKVEVIHF